MGKRNNLAKCVMVVSMVISSNYATCAVKVEFANMGRKKSNANYVMEAGFANMGSKKTNASYVVDAGFASMGSTSKVASIALIVVSMESSSLPAENVETVSVNMESINSNVENVVLVFAHMTSSNMPVLIVCQWSNWKQKVLYARYATRSLRGMVFASLVLCLSNHQQKFQLKLLSSFASTISLAITSHQTSIQ